MSRTIRSALQVLWCAERVVFCFAANMTYLMSRFVSGHVFRRAVSCFKKTGLQRLCHNLALAVKEKIGEERVMPNYFAYTPEQAELLPRHVRDELPPGHLCFLIHELIEAMDLSRFDEAYSEEGQKAYNPRLMLKLWLYGFAVNVRSTRKLERRVQEDLGFRFLAGRLRPDHKTLSEL